VEEVRTILLRQGRKKFGPPDLEDEARIVALDDRDRLRDLILRVLDVATWEELLTDSPNGRDKESASACTDQSRRGNHLSG
jgi:hypothetical protein